MATQKTKQTVPKDWISRKTMLELLAITASSFDAWKVEPAGKIGRQTYYTLRDVIDNRVQNEMTKFTGQVADS